MAERSTAILLRGERTTPEYREITRMLEFFSIPWKAVSVSDGDLEEQNGRYAILSSVDCMVEAIRGAQGSEAPFPSWITKASAIYVYGFQNTDSSIQLLRFLTGNSQATVRPLQIQETIATITDDSPDMCGPMSGLRVPVTLLLPGCICDIGVGGEAFQSIVRTEEGELFFGVTRGGVRFYLNAWERAVDIDGLSAEYFDVKRVFCETVPLIFYLKWAFRDAGWDRGETNACLIVDDPPLKRRYGFLDFSEALDLMDRHNFTTTIAFIPWNWRRTHPGTVNLFRSRPERLSLVVHGCDHTASEFAIRSPALLNRKIRTSRQRMERFERRASIKADRVMVFPQGEFSPETGRALKLNGFIAAVNTEVAPAERAANETTISDLWSLAIMRYGTFPIFTRHYFSHGIENFAFEALLGKPCLIAAHHDVYRDHGRDLAEFVEHLNSLKWNLVWRPLGETLRRSFSGRFLDDGTSVIRMFASSLVVDNSDAEPRKALILKEENDPDCVEAVRVNEAPAEFTVEDGYLRVWLTMPPGETARISLIYRNDFEVLPNRDSSRTHIKVAAKRYLSEFRDNYLSRSAFLYQSANRVKQFLK